MSAEQQKALLNAAASSAMEGLPLEPRHLQTVTEILEGRLTIEDYLDRARNAYGGNREQRM